MKRSNKIFRKLKNRVLCITGTTWMLICIGLLFFFTIGISYGRYVYKEIRNFYLASRNFYFNSDKLKENMARYQIDNWSGVDSFSVTINMNSLKNNKVGSDSDITYDVEFSCSTNADCVSTKTSGVILSSDNTDYFVITITPNVALQEGDAVTLYVKANATSPYTKEISGFFTINVGVPGLSYEISDKANRPYLALDITNTLDYYKVITAFGSYAVGDKLDIGTYLSLSDSEKNNCASAIITLRFDPNIVLLDMTSSAYLKSFNQATTTINGYEYISEISFKIDALSSEVVNFYKDDTTIDYTFPFVNPVSIIGVSYSI